ncbi:MAG TPA: DUF1080 domain-containing protein [Tepidisphaeraceae bacterium]|jgi:hypothetical protein
MAVLPVAMVAGRVFAADKKDAPPDEPKEKDKDAKGQSLFDGKTLGHWKSTEFGGEGEAKVENGQLLLTHGETLTGVTWQGAVPAKMNYEIELDAQRVDGSDFFCGLTFPFNATSASLILGGWGGGVCGISCIDDNDAARNDTTSVHAFKAGQWYHVRLRVTPERIEAWVDKEQIVDADVKGKKISVRGEVEASQPLGIATYQTTGAIKNIRLKKLEAKS